MNRGELIVETARKYLGVPFRHAGMNEHGLDCGGLVLLVMHELGLTTYKPEPYSRIMEPDKLRAQLERHCLTIPLEGIEPGDIILMRAGGIPQHLGIYTGRTLIHSYEIAGKVVEVTWSGYWRKNFEAAFRWRV